MDRLRRYHPRLPSYLRLALLRVRGLRVIRRVRILAIDIPRQANRHRLRDGVALGRWSCSFGYITDYGHTSSDDGQSVSGALIGQPVHLEPLCWIGEEAVVVAGAVVT